MTASTFPPPPSERDLLSTLRRRIIIDYGKLATLAKGLHVTGLRIGATIGTFDLLHPGHARYLMMAKTQCDVLFVGVDSDRCVKLYKKNESRPIVPEDERLEMVLHTGYADYVTLIDDVDDSGAWEYGLLKVVKPHVFITSIGSYPEQQIEDIATHCKEVLEMDRQAETSTSEKVRQLLLTQRQPLADQLDALAARVRKGDFD